jgi:prepilin-type N-terminal cleavage/methylation domain-containing protein
MNRINNNKGFTIIEVVLVLAIAGLIFLMVFIALPALQAGQRDTARKSDVSNVSSAVTTFSSANRGRLPSTSDLETQLGIKAGTPVSYDNLSGNIKSVTTVAAAGASRMVGVEDGVITVYFGFKCGTETNTSTQTSIAKGTARQYATVTMLEGGGGTGYCL